MKGKSPYSVIIILAIGAVLAWVILRLDLSTTEKTGGYFQTELKENNSVPRGPHGGWLFFDEDIRLEVTIFEKGVPPQFRVYPTDRSGNSVDLQEVDLVIELHRLNKVDSIEFKPSGQYLLGNKTVVEPHSFDITIRAQWKDRNYKWEYSQIEARAELSDEAINNAGIKIESAGPAKIKSVLQLTGEIGLNEEKVVHIVPRLDGVVKKVFKDLGDQVKEGEILAILESRELADAKIDYLVARKQTRLAIADLERETLVYQNTSRMLELLEKGLDLEEIYSQLKGLVIGKSRELLIPAYAKLTLSQSVYKREKRLFDKGISSESEYLRALENFKSAEARYVALREKIAYDGEWAVRQKKKTNEMELLNLQTATQKLLALGLTSDEIHRLEEQNEHIFTQYELRSSLNGIVIKKHITTGEAVKKDDGIFVLADLSDVWVNIAIPAKDIKNVHLGKRVRVKSDHLGIEAEGELTYLSSIIEEKTRSVTGRIVIANTKDQWRPGAFVTVELVLDEKTVPLAVLSRAVQTLRDWSVVFVNYGNLFEARPLELGASDEHWVEVLEGLDPGEKYVTENSFTVKAEIEKSGATHSH